MKNISKKKLHLPKIKVLKVHCCDTDVNYVSHVSTSGFYNYGHKRQSSFTGNPEIITHDCTTTYEHINRYNPSAAGGETNSDY